MSFRVKSTHESLKSMRQSVTDKPVPSSKRYTEEKKYSEYQPSKKDTKPKTGTASGLAIRSIPSAQSDHM